MSGRNDSPPIMAPLHISAGEAPFAFEWDLVADHARLFRAGADAIVWSGSLLPLFDVVDASGRRLAIKATVRPGDTTIGPAEARIVLDCGELGHGTLQVTWLGAALQFTALEVSWTARPAPRIRAVYFGSSVLTPEQRAAAPNLERPFWPDWRAEGFCVPSARTNPIQSFFRSWDFGHADLALGSFGPAIGTPYSAAFPRPLYAAGLGGRHGWICLGAGEVPNAALTLQIRSRSGSLEWLHREDLWDAAGAPVRRWENPLWAAWAADAWHAYRTYFRLFPAGPGKNPAHAKTFWGTWGDFRLERFDLRSAVDRAVDEMEADLICIDDPWETGKGSGRPDPHRFPQFAADLTYAHERHLGVGLWLPLGWIADPAAAGLGPDDLLLSRDGTPVRSNWAVDPHNAASSPFCLDPSSERSRRFLRERTRRLVAEHRPTLLKLDFGYGLPGPDACAPRDPAWRGERLAWSLTRLIADAAHDLDPSLTILYYSIHPLWDRVADQCALDDLGDAGVHEAAGHGQWSVWAALAGERGLPLLGSSGYHWEADADNLLNSAILGAPGANLPTRQADGAPLPAFNLARRRALFRWHRRTTTWSPLWIDSTPGDLEHEPETQNWGRLETFAGTSALTALALRRPDERARTTPELRGLEWSGRWIVVAQGDASIFSAPTVVLIPFDAGELALPRDRRPQSVRMVFATDEQEFADWEWNEGRIRLRLTAALASEPMLGLAISDG